MPQIFQVLRCYKCQTFQVHQVKKSNKWVCKMCNEKQSIKRHYGIGTGLECRVHVQKLNGIRGGINDNDQGDESLNESIDSDASDIPDYCNNRKQSKCGNDAGYLENSKFAPNKSGKKQSKWNNYIDEEGECVTKDKDETMYLGNTEVVLEIPNKKPRKKHSTHDFNEYLPDISNSNNISFTNSKRYVRKNNNITNTKPSELKLLLQDNNPNNALNDLHNDDSVESYVNKPKYCNSSIESKWNSKEYLTKCEDKTIYFKKIKDAPKKGDNYNNKKQSKWNNYIDEEDDCITEDKDETMYLKNAEVVLEVPKVMTDDFNESLSKVTNNDKCDNTSNSFTNSNRFFKKYKINSNQPKLEELLQDNRSDQVKCNDITYKNKQIQKESKWNMYINEDTDESTCEGAVTEPRGEQNIEIVSTSKNTKEIFSLCEDGDIDDILCI